MFPGPSGSHQVLRDLGGGPPGSKGPLGFDGRSFGTVPESLRTLGEILGFPRKHRVPPAGALQPRRLGRRSVRDRCGEACLRADGPNATGEVRGSPGGAGRRVAASGRFASRGRRSSPPTWVLPGPWSGGERKKRPRRLPVREPSPAPRGVGVRVLQGTVERAISRTRRLISYGPRLDLSTKFCGWARRVHNI